MSCRRFAKYAIIVFSFIKVLAGIAIIAIGAVAAKNDYTGSSIYLTLFAIVVGAVIFFIAFLGCCGVIKESYCMLTTFAVILIILFILELVVGILALIAIKQDGKALENNIDKTIKDMIKKDDSSLNGLQEAYKCCGAKGPGDYPPGKVPKSCGSYTEGCSKSVKKYFVNILKAVGGVTIFFAIIELAGIAIIAIGAVAAKNDYTGSSKHITLFAIAVGAVIFCIAFLGCCGAIKESSCMLTTFAVILIILFILELVVGILALVAIKQDGKELENTIDKTIEDMIKKDDSSLNDLQEAFKCCGVKGPGDYPPGKVPKSCGSYTEGCSEPVRKYFVNILKAVGGVTIFFAIIEVLGASFACYVRNRIGD